MKCNSVIGKQPFRPGILNCSFAIISHGKNCIFPACQLTTISITSATPSYLSVAFLFNLIFLVLCWELSHIPTLGMFESMFVPFPARWDMLALSLEGISSYQDIRFGEAEGLKININHIKTTTATTRWASIYIYTSSSRFISTPLNFNPQKQQDGLLKTTKNPPNTHPSWLTGFFPAPCNFTGPTAPAEELREPWCFFRPAALKNPVESMGCHENHLPKTR